MITVSAKDIKDFMVCELYYKFDNIDNKDKAISNRLIFNRKFENTIKKVLSFFFYKKQAGLTPSYNALLNRWEKLWFPKDITAYDLALEQHNIRHGNYVNFSNRATWVLEKFYNEFADDKRIPMMIDETFLVPLYEDVRLEGSFDLVLRTQDHKYEIIRWTGLDHTLLKGHDVRLDTAAQKYAFDHRNDHKKRATYKMYNLNAKSAFGWTKTPQPSKKDLDYMKYWAMRIRDTELYVPRRGFTVYCKSCPFDTACAHWQEWPEI